MVVPRGTGARRRRPCPERAPRGCLGGWSRSRGGSSQESPTRHRKVHAVSGSFPAVTGRASELLTIARELQQRQGQIALRAAIPRPPNADRLAAAAILGIPEEDVDPQEEDMARAILDHAGLRQDARNLAEWIGWVTRFDALLVALLRR